MAATRDGPARSWFEIGLPLRVRGGERVEVKLSAPKPRDPTREADVLYDDAHVIVINKPAGVSSVPYDNRELGTATAVITHNAPIAEIADRVVTLADGRVHSERTVEHRARPSELRW